MIITHNAKAGIIGWLTLGTATLIPQGFLQNLLVIISIVAMAASWLLGWIAQHNWTEVRRASHEWVDQCSEDPIEDPDDTTDLPRFGKNRAA